MSPLVRTILVGVLGLATLGTSGCQDDGPEPAPQPTKTASSPSDQSSSASPTDGTTSSTPASGVTPAAGPELHLRVMSVHAPQGWQNDEGQVSASEVSASSDGGLLQLIELEDAADVGINIAAKNFVKGLPAGADYQRLPDVLLGQDQTKAARIAWTEQGSPNHYEVVLAYRDDVSASLHFMIRPSLQKSDPQFVDSVLASVQWLV